MGVDWIRVLAHIHGHAGWLAVAALIHPAILLRNPTRRAHLSVAIAVAFVTIAASAGVLVYPAYSDNLRQLIFLHAPRVGWFFERKEHLAYGAVMLAWAGTAAYAGAEGAKGELRASLRVIAFRAFALAASLAVVAAAIGTMVASYKGL